MNDSDYEWKIIDDFLYGRCWAADCKSYEKNRWLIRIIDNEFPIRFHVILENSTLGKLVYSCKEAVDFCTWIDNEFLYPKGTTNE